MISCSATVVKIQLENLESFGHVPHSTSRKTVSGVFYPTITAALTG